MDPIAPMDLMDGSNAEKSITSEAKDTDKSTSLFEDFFMMSYSFQLLI